MIQPSYRSIAAYLAHGGLIAYPTESCYGLGCDPANRAAVRQLLRLKQRPQKKGLILIASSYQQVARYLLPIPQEGQKKLREAGEQTITCLMPVKKTAPRWLRGAHDTLAVRLTSHAYAKQLCSGVKSALVSSSANKSGMRPVKNYAECQRLFGKKVWVLPGQVGKRRQPSTIMAWADGRVVRR